MTNIRLIEEPNLVTLDTGNYQANFWFEVVTERGGILRDDTSNYYIGARMTRRLYAGLRNAGYSENEMIKLLYVDALDYIKNALISETLEEETVLETLGPKDAPRLKEYEPAKIDIFSGHKVDQGSAKQAQRVDEQREAQMTNQVQVFLCHASEDRDEVMDVYRRLEEEGFKPWIDKEDILSGQDWDRAIRKTIKQSDFALAFFSEISVSKRGYYQKELKLLLEVLDEMPEGQVFVIPIRLDECEIPETFKKYQCTDLFETNGLDKVIASIREHSKPPEPDRSPGSVRLAAPLQLIQGWPEMAKAAEKELDALGLDHWEIVVRLLTPEEAPENPDELPWPEFYDEKSLMEFSVRPEPIIGKREIESWSTSIVGFLLQYVYPDDLFENGNDDPSDDDDHLEV